MITMTSVEAQSRFVQLLDAAQRETVAITQDGRPTAFVVSPQDMKELLDARNRRSKAVAELEAWNAEAERLAGIASGLSDEEVVRLVHESR
jgi:prevent-host-death family protein